MADWKVSSAPLAGDQGALCSVTIDSRPATFADVVRGWRDDAAFRELFNGWLAGLSFAAFRWELPAVTAKRAASMAFEYVVLDSPGLARAAEPEAFAEHFVGSTAPVVSFANLRGDATLVVPRPLAEPSVYAHLGAFVREAPAAQRDAFWQAVGAAMAERLGRKPVWLNTAGAGVAWLHVRLDDRPKYYRHASYR